MVNVSGGLIDVIMLMTVEITAMNSTVASVSGQVSLIKYKYEKTLVPRLRVDIINIFIIDYSGGLWANIFSLFIYLCGICTSYIIVTLFIYFLVISVGPPTCQLMTSNHVYHRHCSFVMSDADFFDTTLSV